VSDRPRIIVTAEQLRVAFRVWLKVAPARLWRKNEEAERLKAEKRWNPDERTDPRDELADHMAGKFLQANWEASYSEWENIFSNAYRKP
jgi:hypothetical protein